MQRVMHWDYIVIVSVLGVFVPWRRRTRVRMLLESGAPISSERINLYLSTIVFQCVICIVIAWRFAARGGYLRALGFALPRSSRPLIAIAVLCALLVLNQVLGVRRLTGLPSEKRGVVGRLAERLLPRTRLERYVALALVLTVALCEEFIYRGFVEYLFQRGLSSIFAGATISAVLFALAHLYQGPRCLITTFIVGLILSGARIWTASLIPPIAIHFSVDFSAGVASLRMLAPRTQGA
jgi:uncharacterized protein